ncbi:uncharacterized protein ARMOST_16996 [Armillaria ostoyae]|uniref:Uncharacterized protein n=1 Tax=Armillaria ostoyae TaxID=47428 RepID=A0A284RXT3_ARMOS|nr:uncharacterized protein ARMOST_16996 [Armillaria ostoyae]
MAPAKHAHPRGDERGVAEERLREELVVMRRDLFKEKIPGRSLLSPQALMPTTLLEHIVDLVHYGQLSTLDDVQRELTWAHADTWGPRILELIGPVHDKVN